MAVSSFLAEGAAIPQGSALTDMTKQQVLPEWYSNYAMDILSGQQAIANRPYETAPMPRVAGFTPTQQQAFGMTGTAATAYQPMLNAATAATQGAMGVPGSLATSQPYFNQAINMNGVTAATPGLQQGAQFTAQSADALGINAAQPYLQQAGQSSVANIGQYMNPYNDAVTNRIGELGTRNLTENLLPAIEGRYIQAGQLGYGGRGGLGGTPSGMMTDTARTLRDVNADILAQQTAALQSGYTQAAGLAGTDLARQSQLAQTAGGLGTQQQGALAQAGQQMANIGQTYGTLTGAQQRAISDIGTSAGTFAGQDITRSLQGAQLAGLGEDAQRLGLTGAGALGGVGALEQQQGQKNLDVAYQDFLRQQGYPQEQINNMLKTFQGTASGVPSATQEYGISPAGVKQEYSSTGKDIASALTAAAGIVGSLKGK